MAAELVKDKNNRIQLMINLNLWEDAITTVYKYKLQDFYIDEIRRKAPADLIE